MERKAQWAGVFVTVLGLYILLAAIFNWNWIFEGQGNKISLPWIARQFGRNTARIVAGILGSLIVIYGVYFTLHA